MKTLHFQITIQAPRQHVWDTMLAPETYKQWTAAFCEGIMGPNWTNSRLVPGLPTIKV